MSYQETRKVEKQLAVLAGQRNAIDADIIDTVVHAIEQDLWQGDGIRSVTHWLTLHLGASRSRAHQIEATARRITEFPLTADKFRTGALSADQVHAAIEVAPAWADLHTHELIEHATVPQIRRLIRHEFPPEPTPPVDLHSDAGRHAADYDGDIPDDELADAESADGESADESAADESAVDDRSADRAAASESGRDVAFGPLDDRVSLWWTADGRLTGSFDLSAPTGMLVEAALHEAKDALFREGFTNASFAQALGEVCGRSIMATSNARTLRHRAYLHFDVGSTSNSNRSTGADGDAASATGIGESGATAAGSASGVGLVAELANARCVPPTVLEYLSCDLDITPVWERDNTPIGTGTTTRTIPHHLRRLVERRDQGCRVPGCGIRQVELHHIIHWLHRGPTETWNLISLCAAHHRMHHNNRLGISGNADDDADIRFTDHNDRPLRVGPTPALPDRYQLERARQTSDTEYSHPHGTPMMLRNFSKWEPQRTDQYHARSRYRAWRAEHLERSRPIKQVA